MKNLLKKLLQKKLEIPEPSRYPNSQNIVEWMDEKIAYHAYKFPDNMDSLFNPSSGDYIPLLIAVGASTEEFKKHIQHYRDVKSQYPEAVIKGKEGFLEYSYFRSGDPLDYPAQ